MRTRPLGVTTRVLDEKVLTAYNNSSVVQRICQQEQVPLDQGNYIFQELLRFLDLCHDSVVPVVPSKVLDRAWHIFILHTVDYAKYCSERFGQFVHHNPSEHGFENTYERTRRQAVLRYGNLDPDIWPVPSSDSVADCAGGCTSP
jgi:hypothetical protein